MKTQIHTKLLACLGAALLAAAGLPSPAHAATTLFSDDFSLSRPGGATLTADTTISGVAIEYSSSGSAAWGTLNGGSASFTADGAMYVPSGNLGAKITLPSFSQAITVQADVHYTANPGTGWVAVGFQRASNSSPYGSTNVLGRLNYGGSWSLYDQGTTGGAVATGTITGFDSTAVHTLAVEYDPTVSTYGALSLFVDNVNVSGSIVLTATDKVTALATATFFLQNTGTNATLDNFLVTEAAAIPEPSSLSLIFGALGLALGLGMKIARRPS